MRVFIADFETYWSSTHSLTKMNPINYVMHPDTEIQSLAIKELKSPETYVYFGEDRIRGLCDQTDWSDVMLVGHNMSGFDAMIFAWRLGVRPKMWGCTLAMARPHFALTSGVSLRAVADALGLGSKGDIEATNTKGKRVAEFTPSELAAMREYNKLDTQLCEGVFKALGKITPKKELLVIDHTIRMLVDPMFHVDTAMLEATLGEEQKRKQLVLLDLATMLGEYHVGMEPDEAANAVSKTLGSAAKFSKLLHDLGVPVPTKVSAKTGKQIPALAKDDAGFLELQDHTDPIVSAAAMARLGVKSTLLESRIKSFLDVASVTGGKMPIAQNYYAAHTGRGGGSMKLNQCNLPRVRGKPTDVLRNCLVPPPGYKVVVVDLSGIELRVNMFLWKVPYAMELFTADPENADLYKEFAAALYGVDVASVVKSQRTVGKVAHLGLGYGAGAKTFQKVAKTMGGIDLELEASGDPEAALSATEIVFAYRAQHVEVVNGWTTCGGALKAMVRGEEMAVDPWGMVQTTSDGLLLPSGRFIRYPDIRYEYDEETNKRSLVYGAGRNKTYVHGSKVDENIVQALSRDILKDNAIELDKALGFHAHEVYDELVYIVPEAEADAALHTMLGVMRTPPKWWPELAVWAAGDIADSYGAAK